MFHSRREFRLLVLVLDDKIHSQVAVGIGLRRYVHALEAGNVEGVAVHHVRIGSGESTCIASFIVRFIEGIPFLVAACTGKEAVELEFFIYRIIRMVGRIFHRRVHHVVLNSVVQSGITAIEAETLGVTLACYVVSNG